MTSGDLISFIGHLLSTRRYEFGFVAAAILFEVLVRSRLRHAAAAQRVSARPDLLR